MMLQKFRADIHIHTCLSPCGELEMSPEAIVRVSHERELDFIAICDHNSAKNVYGVQKAAKGTTLTVLCGIEVTTAEEVHILGIFNRIEQVIDLQDMVYDHLLPGENDEDLFGLQVVTNELGEVKEIEKRLLIGGTTFSLNLLINKIHEYGGLAIASHIDRDSFSLLGQLGMIPNNFNADAMEISSYRNIEAVLTQVPEVKRYPLITSSDAHSLEEIGQSVTAFYLEEVTIEEIRKAFRGEDGRQIIKIRESC
jgi:predicted metal-dependent phosphoesterase TrpH